MKKLTLSLLLAAGLAGQSGLASADIANSPNPYNAGYGFDYPQQAVWGGWSRGDAGTVYAEWDSFNFDGQLLAGSYGLTNAQFGWDGGTSIDGNGNLANDTDSIFAYADIQGSVAQASQQMVRVAMQLEAWVADGSNGVDYDNIWLNGLTPTFLGLTDTGNSIVVDSIEYALYQSLAIWDLDFAPAGDSYSFDLSASAGTRIAQVAVDMAAVAQGAPIAEAPVAVPLPGAAWMFMSALFGMLAVRRKSPLSQLSA